MNLTAQLSTILRGERWDKHYWHLASRCVQLTCKAELTLFQGKSYGDVISCLVLYISPITSCMGNGHISIVHISRQCMKHCHLKSSWSAWLDENDRKCHQTESSRLSPVSTYLCFCHAYWNWSRNSLHLPADRMKDFIQSFQLLWLCFWHTAAFLCAGAETCTNFTI